MKLDKKTMLKLMKEEFDKRLKHYLGEIETKDSKRDVDIVKNAQGLKVKNEQGLELSIDNVVVIDNQEYVVLRKPEDARKGTNKEDNIFHSQSKIKSKEDSLLSSAMVKESDEDTDKDTDEDTDEEETSNVGGDLRSKSKDMNYKRSITKYNASLDSLKGAKIEDDKIYVLITDFEKEYSL